MEEKDFFSLHFDMTKFPSSLSTDQGKEERSKLSGFFNLFYKYYFEAILKTKIHYLHFTLSRPFNMLYGINKDKLFFVITNRNSLKSRAALYRVSDENYIDFHKMAEYAAICGFPEDSIFSEVPARLFLEADNQNMHEEIREEANNLVEFELNEFEKDNKIMRINPLFGNHEYLVNDKKVFMLMPFGDETMNEFYEDHIKSAIESIDMHCIRADDIFNNKSIIDDIWRNINEAKIIIADLTHRNPNVFYEVGIAHTLGKEVILISQIENDIPFDLRHIRTIFYKNTARGAQEFRDTLCETISGVLQQGKIQ